MKRKFFFIAITVLLVGFSSSIVIAEGGGGEDCATCYGEEYWGQGPDYQAHANGDCYANGVFCGTILQCVMGWDFCNPVTCGNCGGPPPSPN
ncbi:MAG: hypothetical protein U9N86_00095 [Bacteroidota bacterium]|nr:hypothetical protein [Bacteroidota bacterium]